MIKRLVPPSLFRHFSRQAVRAHQKTIGNMIKLLPRVKLQEIHIANLKPLVDRQALLAHLPKAGNVCELGVNEGDFSADILRITRPRTLKLVDPWDSRRYGEKKYQAVAKRFSAEIASGQVELLRGYSTGIGPQIADGSLDWVYVDTTHSYELTRDELRLYASKLIPGGILAGHDYQMGNFRKGIVYGVIEAVQEFCVREDWEFVFLTMESVAPSFGIRKL